MENGVTVVGNERFVNKGTVKLLCSCLYVLSNAFYSQSCNFQP